MANTKITANVIAADAILSVSIADAAVTADKLHATLDLSGKTLTLPSTQAATTQAASDNTTKVATTAYVTTALANLADSAPSTLNTLNELAAALGDDANFSTTVTNSIATKLPLAGGTMTGAIAMGTAKITGLGDPTANQDAGTKTYIDTADALKAPLASPTFTGTVTAAELAVDTSTLVVDATNNRVGIGTTDPQELLHLSATTPVFRMQGGSRSYQQYVSGTDFVIRDVTATANRITLNSSGNVGIGTISPNAPLTVWTASTTGLQTALRLNNPFGFANEDTGTQIVFSQDRTTAENYTEGIIAVGQDSPGSSSYSYMAFHTNNLGVAERMRINYLGNVGIGTASPSQLLHLGGATNKGIQITSSTSNAGYLAVYQDQTLFGSNRDPADGSFADAGKTAQFIGLQSGDGLGWIKFSTTATNNIEPSERMRITGAGNVGIGTDNPTSKLNVQGASASTYTGAGPDATIIASQGSAGNWIASEHNGAFAYFGIDTARGKFAAYNYATNTDMDMILGQDRMLIKAGGGVRGRILNGSRDTQDTFAIGLSDVIQPNLLLYFNVANSNSYSGSGTTVTDLSGNGNTCYLGAGVGYSTSNGGYFTFAGNENSSTSFIGTPVVLPTNDRVTYMCWIYYNDADMNDLEGHQLNGIQAGAGYCYVGRDPGYAASVYAYIGAGSAIHNTNSPGNGQQWEHVAITRDSGSSGYGKQTVYINGEVSVSNMGLAPTAHTATFTFGGVSGASNGGGSASYTLNGRIASGCIYNRALSQAEIIHNMMVDAPRLWGI